MPPTRLGNMHESSIQPGVAKYARTRPRAKRMMAKDAWVASSAPMRKIDWLLPPMASAVAPRQVMMRGWGRTALASGVDSDVTSPAQCSCAAAWVTSLIDERDPAKSRWRYQEKDH